MNLESLDSPTLPLEAMAAAIRSRGLQVPAIFLLELHKPLATIGAVAVEAFTPLASMLFNPKSFQAAAGLLRSRAAIERLIILLEEAR